MTGSIISEIFIIIISVPIILLMILLFLEVLYVTYSNLFENSDFINFIKRKVERRRREQKAKEKK